MADDKNDQPFGGQIPGAANGKDVLYGWLVGRAAADLGLAQAIAASEAQRAEQIRRLEEALMGQMRELQNSQTAPASAANNIEVDRLKDRVEQFSERQNFLEAQQLTSGQLEAQLASKIRELEAHIAQPPTAVADHEVNDLRVEIAGLAERVAQAESTAHRAPPIDNRLVQEQIGRAVREQTAALQSQLLAQLQQQTATVGEFATLADSWQNKLDQLQQEIDGKAALMAGLAERVSQVELVAARQPAPGEQPLGQAQIVALVREQTEALAGQLFAQRQNQTSVAAEFTALENSLQTKLDGLQREIEDKATLLAELSERVGHAEAPAREPAPADNSLAEKQIAAAVRAQTEALKTQLFEQLHRQTAVDSEFKALQSALQNRLDGVQQEVREKAALLRLRDTELGDLRGQLAGLAQRLDQVAAIPSPEAQAAEREAERAQWQRDFDERLTVRLRELGDEIRGKLQGVTSVKVDQEQFRGETLALTARVAQLEQAKQNLTAGAATEAREAYQATLALRGEIAGLKSALLEQQRTQPDDSAIRNAEEMLRGQILEVRQQLAQNQRGSQERESQFSQLRGDIQTLMQRQAQAETLAQQTHALVTQETAQLRGGLKADLVSIEAQLNERRGRDAALQGMEETLHQRMRELHSQLAQGMLAQDQRDSEFREIKSQLQMLAQQVSQASAAAPALPPLGSFTPSLQTAGLRPVSVPASLDSAPNLLQPATVPGNGHGAEPPKLVAIDLHDRLSAEIERKRAELREKSGRWKVHK